MRLVKITTRPPSFGDLIRSIRTGRKLGLREVSRSSGIDAALLSKIETGKRLPPQGPALLELSKALGVGEGSDDFAALALASNRERNPDFAEILVSMSGTLPRADESPSTPVFVDSLAELLSRSTEYAIRSNAKEIVVKSDSGVKTFKVLASTEFKRSKEGGRS